MMPTPIKLFILALCLLVRLSQCRKIIRQAYYYSGFGDSDVEHLNSLIEQAGILHTSIWSSSGVEGRMPLFWLRLKGFAV